HLRPWHRCRVVGRLHEYRAAHLVGDVFRVPARRRCRGHLSEGSPQRHVRSGEDRDPERLPQGIRGEHRPRKPEPFPQCPETEEPVIKHKRRKIRQAKANGILMPKILFEAAEWARIPYWAACAFAMQETSGGKNIYGHDGGPGHPFYGHGKVTECNYRAYKKEADRTGKRQGVGPLQLTS